MKSLLVIPLAILTAAAQDLSRVGGFFGGDHLIPKYEVPRAAFVDPYRKLSGRYHALFPLFTFYQSSGRVIAK